MEALFRGLYPQAFDPAAKNIAVLADAEVDAAAWRMQERGVAATRVESVDGTARYALATRDPKCYWQAALKIVRGIDPSTPYVCSARISNPTTRQISVQLLAQTVSGDSLLPCDTGQYNSVHVPPGESRSVSVFFTTSRKRNSAARICVSPHRLGDDRVYVDDLRLVKVGGANVQKRYFYPCVCGNGFDIIMPLARMAPFPRRPVKTAVKGKMQ